MKTFVIIARRKSNISKKSFLNALCTLFWKHLLFYSTKKSNNEQFVSFISIYLLWINSRILVWASRSDWMTNNWMRMEKNNMNQQGEDENRDYLSILARISPIIMKIFILWKITFHTKTDFYSVIHLYPSLLPFDFQYDWDLRYLYWRDSTIPSKSRGFVVQVRDRACWYELGLSALHFCPSDHSDL